MLFQPRARSHFMSLPIVDDLVRVTVTSVKLLDVVVQDNFMVDNWTCMLILF